MKGRCGQGWAPSGGSGERPSCLSQLLVAQAFLVAVLSQPLPLLSWCLSQGHSSWDLGPTQTQDDLISGSLIISAEVLFLNEVAFQVSDGWEVGMDRFVGGGTPRPARQSDTSCSVEGSGPGLSFPSPASPPPLDPLLCPPACVCQTFLAGKITPRCQRGIGV